jgi:hypothetical protein
MEEITKQSSATQSLDEHSARTAGASRAAATEHTARLRQAASLHWARLRAAFDDAGVELLMILLWTLLIAAPYANMSPLEAPRGIEYFTLIQSNHVWMRFQECGWCALWNGSVRGGAPAFVDPHASLLHPLVIASTLLLGVINGSKLALLGAFFMAGVAQWWLARVLGIERIARLWSAGMAVAAGFLAAQMGEGLFSMVISTVSCMLVLPALIGLAQTGSRRAAVTLGITLALAIVAGQGYMQFGLGLLAPVALLFPRGVPVAWGTLLRRYALAIVLALLLAAPFLVPFLHFLPEFHKNADPEFASAQPLTYVLFNLVISDHDLYLTNALGKLPYPFLYANFIGWVPVGLALWSLHGSRSQAEQRVKLCLLAMAAIALWAASAVPLRWITHLEILPWLSNQVARIRNCSLIAGLAIPPLLALAALGLERLVEAPWLEFELMVTNKTTTSQAFALDLRWLLVIPLGLALLLAQQFGKGWIATDPYPSQIEPIVETLRTPDIQWVNTPLGDNPYEQVAIAKGLKLAYGFRAWDWNYQPLPFAYRLLSHREQLPDMINQQAVADVHLYAAPPGIQYATLTHADGTQLPCTAHGIDGMIDVECDSPVGGELVLSENSWDGWQARIDGQPTTRKPILQLAVDLPAGRHTVSFRYQPWDVPLGLFLGLLGVALALYEWRKGDLASAPPAC